MTDCNHWPGQRRCQVCGMNNPTSRDLVAMARAAQHDERLSDGALYGKLADEIEALLAARETPRHG